MIIKVKEIYDNHIKMRIFVQLESRSMLLKILSLSFGTADKMIGECTF